jgi:hypothetical protein
MVATVRPRPVSLANYSLSFTVLGAGYVSCSCFVDYLLLGNDEIETQLKRDRLMAKNEIKMLLLGAGESGKVRRP